MAKNMRPIQFLDYLPQYLRSGEAEGMNILSRFLEPMETMFENLEAAIEGNIISLTYIGGVGRVLSVKEFESGDIRFVNGTPVRIPGTDNYSRLSKEIPAGAKGVSNIEVEDDGFADRLKTGDVIEVFSGGISDLFNLAVTPPPEFRYTPTSEYDFLAYIAGFTALPLREDKSAQWNRSFLQAAIPLYRERYTLNGLRKLLEEWLKGEIIKGTVILTDLTRTHTDVDTVFQLGDTSVLGVDTVLGEGPAHFFVVDLVIDSTAPVMRCPEGIFAFQRAVKYFLDAEKPANSYYRLCVHASTMQLAPDKKTPEDTDAQIGETTMLYGEPWIIEGR
ncbi:MAG: hypothetical protein N3I35_13835 [Clostridia bacterium]|nr:hypothetical protein [Clostridia bacterium]